MAKIEVPDFMVPNGWELGKDGVEFARKSVGDECGTITVHIPIRRKPRLKQIVFVVTGEPQRLTHGDYYLDGGNTVARWLELEGSCSKYQRLHRKEVYE